jgi:hypothetical protein
VYAGRVFGRVIASGVIALLVATIALPAIWPDAPWASTVEAASCKGVKLTAPNAAPRTGTPTTLIQFSVTYVDSGNCKPSTIVAVIPGFGQAPLTATGTSYTTGVRYSRALRLPIGTWSYQFYASAGAGGPGRTDTVIGPGTIVIVAPTPTPTPTPKPTPKPTPRPTPKPTAQPTPRATVSPSLGTHPTAKPTAGPGSSGSSGTPDPGSGAGASTRPGPSQPPGAAGPVDHSGRDDAGALGPPDNGGDADSGFAFRLPGLDLDPSSALPLGTWLVTTTLGVLLFAAVFNGRGLAVELPGELSVLVMKRRRGARGGPRRSAGVHPDRGVDQAAGAVVVDAAPGGASTQPNFDEARRQIGATGRPPRRFARPPAKGVDRRVIAYRSVRVSAGPDELRTAELTRLDRRDEVEVIGEEAGSLRIRTPDGVEGWVPRVVLVGAPPVEGAAAVEESKPATKPRRRRVPALRRGPTVIDPAQPAGGT